MLSRLGLALSVSTLASAFISLQGCSASSSQYVVGDSAAQYEQAIAIEDMRLPRWEEGYLDIHHIQTGRGNSTFAIFPDGTTLLIDAGALDDSWADNYQPLKMAPGVPDLTKRPGEWIADYIGQFLPDQNSGLDFALVTHFHTDHYGKVDATAPKSTKGGWHLAGITDVAEHWPIRTYLDRAYPSYDIPNSLEQGSDPSFSNLVNFVRSKVQTGEMNAERFEVGDDDQISCVLQAAHCVDFSVENIAANGIVWAAESSRSIQILDYTQLISAGGRIEENPLSIVLKINYGDFDYVTGGDLTGINEPDKPSWFAIEKAIAPHVGEADVITLNHHGNRDATSAEWLRSIKPRVLIQQTWVSDHPGGEVVARMISRTIWPGDRDIFATYVHPETQVAIGPWLTRNYSSLRGHVVVRVSPGGKHYQVFTLDDTSQSRPLLGKFGPYKARP